MPVITPDLFERAHGCLLGAAIGDAFGMALEGALRQPVNAQVRALRQGRLPLGHFTDATGALLTVAERLLDSQPFDPEELAGPLTAWQKRRLSHAEGARPPLLSRLLVGPPPGDPAAASPLAGDTPAACTLTRCLPVALACIGDRSACLQQARTLIRITHPHPECVAGGAFVAAVLWHLLRGMAPREAMREGLLACSDLPETLRQTIREAPGRPREQLANGELVPSTLESVAWGLASTASYTEAVTRVANLGGNATTAGALAGAMAGAAYRHSGIPADWRAQVRGLWPPQGGHVWRERDLTELARRLVLSWGH